MEECCSFRSERRFLSEIRLFFAFCMGLLPFCSSPEGTSDAPPPAVIAHRGASALAPENTVPAVEAAWEKGADAVELDVRISADEELVVIHDRTTERTTEVKQQVAKTPFDSLKELDAGSWFAPKFANTRIPSLDSMMDHVPADKELLIEFKSGPESIPLLEDLLSEREAIPAFSIISFDPAVLIKAKERLPAIPTYWVLPRVHALTPVLRKGEKAGFDGLNMRKSNFMSGKRIPRIREKGLNLLAWTVNDIDRAVELKRLGVQGIVTDHPGKLRKAFEKMKQKDP